MWRVGIEEQGVAGVHVIGLVAVAVDDISLQHIEKFQPGMLEGHVVYRHGGKTYDMHPGDALFFDADAPHGPEELRDLPIRYLSVISYRREE